MSGINRQAELPPEDRREAIADLRDLVARGHDGDEEALARMDTVLEQIPSIARKFGNLNIMVEEGFIERTAANSPFRQKAVRVSLEDMREDLAGPDPSPLERLQRLALLLAQPTYQVCEKHKLETRVVV